MRFVKFSLFPIAHMALTGMSTANTLHHSIVYYILDKLLVTSLQISVLCDLHPIVCIDLFISNFHPLFFLLKCVPSAISLSYFHSLFFYIIHYFRQHPLSCHFLLLESRYSFCSHLRREISFPLIYLSLLIVLNSFFLSILCFSTVVTTCIAIRDFLDTPICYLIYFKTLPLLNLSIIALIFFPFYSFLSIFTSGVSDKSGTALTKAMAAIVSSIPEAVSIMPLEIAKVRNFPYLYPVSYHLVYFFYI